MGVGEGGSFECGAFVFAGDLTGHAPDAKAVPATVPVCRIQCTGERVQEVSVRATIRRSGPVVQVGSSEVVIC